MTHVEFIGPPAAGKSTIYSRLISNDAYFGGTADDATRRLFLARADSRYKLPYRITPRPLRSFVEREFIEPRLRHLAFREFISDYPEYLDILSLIAEHRESEFKKLISLCKYTVESYQLGISTTRPNEIFCLDEGFAQRGLSILWRIKSERFPVDRYIQSTPTPELLIYVAAPDELCINRQRARSSGDIKTAVEWKEGDVYTVQEELRKRCEYIVDCFSEQTSVVTVRNTESLNSAVSAVLSAMDKLEREL